MVWASVTCRSCGSSGFADGEPGWPGYGAERRTTRIYDLKPDVGPYPEEASMHLWERHQFDALGLVPDS